MGSMRAEYVTTLMTRSSVKQINYVLLLPESRQPAIPDGLSVPAPFRSQSVSPLDSSEFVKKKFQHTGPTIAEKSRSPTYAQYYAIIN